MKMRATFNLSILIFGLPLLVHSQDHSHPDHHHAHLRNEIAISNNLVFLGKDQKFAYGAHLHYLRYFRASKFGAGVGYERIFDEHGHNTISMAGSYRPFHELILLVSPGITFEDHGDEGFKISAHLEAGYEFEIDHFHLGPVLGVAFTRENYHLRLGLHLGYSF